MPHLSEAQIFRFLVELTLLLLVSRTMGDLMKRLGQAPVIGELLAGVIVGPSVLGSLAPGAFSALFGGDPMSLHLLEAFAWTGAILLLLYIGLETDLDILRGQGRAAASVSVCGMVIPFICGIVLGLSLPAQYLAAPDQRFIFALFMGVAIAISAVPVIAKILIELGLMRRELGMLILAAGLIDDTTGWLLLSLVAGLASGRAVSAASFGLVLAEAGAFIAFCYFAGVRIAAWLVRWVDDRGAAEHGKFSAMILVAFACAIVTQAIGLHAVFGAFVAGLMLSRAPRVRARDRAEIEAVTMGLMAPVFFAYSGLQANLTALESPFVPLIVLGVACAAKIGGAFAGGRLGGLEFRESLAVAFGMNARGGMEIILALLGLSLGVLTPATYTMIVAVAVVTSIITPPLLTWALSGASRRPGDAERAERDRILARMPLRTAGAKLLVLSGGGPHAELAAHLAGTLCKSSDASVTMFHAAAGDSNGAGAASAFGAQFARLKEIATAAGAANVYHRTGSGESIIEAIVQESERGYDAIFAGASQVHGHAALGGEVLRELFVAVRAPVVIASNAGAATPVRKLLLPVSGASFARLGAMVGMLYAQAAGAEATALYVRQRSILDLRTLAGGAAISREGEEAIGEIHGLARQLDLKIASRIESGVNAESVILRTLKEGQFDLLMMGALFRSAEERLYFGSRVDQILRSAGCAVAVVVAPEQATRG
ncbi:MAG TPA: cation:proton antiporter [Candidatus Binataceae bacterium]|nr:cation:proton antiporter [Candidatus Binataceae bacterium]